MSQKIMLDDGSEIDVFTKEEMKAAADEAVKTASDEFTVKLTDAEKQIADANKALGERAGEFKQFRKLSDEAVAKLGVAERTIYDNTLLMQKMNEDKITSEKKVLDASVDSVIRARVGTDEKAFVKIKEMWSLLGIEAITPDQMLQKTNMILGAISMSQPDLLATVAGFGGGS